MDEKVRLINNFAWGTLADPVKTGVEVGAEVIPTTVDTPEYIGVDIDYELTESELMVAYVTISLNILFLLCFIVYIIIKCCCVTDRVIYLNTFSKREEKK